MSHKQVRIRCNGQSADIDEEIVPLIRAIWKNGIRTVMSCQENMPGIAWVMFATVDDAKAFLGLVAEYPPGYNFWTDGGNACDPKVPFWETLYGRIAGYGDEDNWQYDVRVEDCGVEERLVNDTVYQRCVGPADFNFAVSIRFPKSDMPLILEQMERAGRVLQDLATAG